MQTTKMNSVATLVVAALALGASVTTAQTAEPCEVNRFEASNGAAGDWFGRGVSTSGNVSVVGAPHHDPAAGTNAGGAYVFERPGAVWTETALLTAPNGAADDEFGWSVANTETTVIVGAPLFDSATLTDVGSAYVYELQGSTWVQTATLSPTPAGAGDEFGFKVAIEGDTAVISAPLADNAVGADAGSVFLFRKLFGTWTQVDRLDALDAGVGGGGAGDEFGASVSISNGYLVVGSPYEDSSGSNAGAAYVYSQTSGGFTWQAKLAGSGTSASDYFGRSVANIGDTVLVGGYGDFFAAFAAGSAYVFEQDPMQAGTWVQTAQLSHPAPGHSDYFGFAVAMADNVGLVGSYLDNNVNGTDSGSMFAFRRDENGTPSDKTDDLWLQAHSGELLDGVPGTNDRFATEIAVAGDTLIVGEYLGDAVAGAEAGTATLWSSSGTDFPSISGSPDSISISAGGTQTLSLNTCAGLEGGLFVMFGTTAGTLPGFDLFGYHVPLNPSGAWWTITTRIGGAPVLSPQVAPLGAEGTASVNFTLPPMLVSPSFVGATVHHAFGVFSGGQIQFVSNAAAVQLVL